VQQDLLAHHTINRTRQGPRYDKLWEGPTTSTTASVGGRRFLADGNMDTSFAAGGKYRSDVPGCRTPSPCSDDEKILLARKKRGTWLRQ